MADAGVAATRRSSSLEKKAKKQRQTAVGLRPRRRECSGDPDACACVIDTSTKESLENDFRKWLDGGVLRGLRELEKPRRGRRPKNRESEPSTSQGPSRPAPPPTKKKADGRRINKTGITVNTYGRRYLPGRPLGMKQRQLIVDCHTSGMKVSLIGKLMGVSHGCVSKIIARYQSVGSLAPAYPVKQRWPWNVPHPLEDDSLSSECEEGPSEAEVAEVAEDPPECPKHSPDSDTLPTNVSDS